MKGPEPGLGPGRPARVGVFFTLSDYLITDLLLTQWETTGRMRLADFWRRRALAAAFPQHGPAGGRAPACLVRR